MFRTISSKSPNFCSPEVVALLVGCLHYAEVSGVGGFLGLWKPTKRGGTVVDMFLLVRFVEGFAGGGCPGAPGPGYNCVHNGLTVSEQKDVFLKTELLGG
jgi:hypothetical protein